MVKGYSHTTILYTLIGLGLLAAQTLLVPIYVDAFRQDVAIPSLGWLFLVALILEPILIYLRPGRSTKTKDDPAAGVAIAWVMHLGLTGMITLTAFTLLGVDIYSDRGGLIIGLAMVVGTIKELAILFLGISKAEGPGKTRSKKTQILVDIGIMFVSVVFYMAFWDLLIQTTDNYSHLAGRIFNTCVAAFMFILFFLAPMNALLYKTDDQANPWSVYISWASVTAIAVWPILFS